MSDKHRYYPSGVKEALFLLSRGRCYEPSCQARVLRQVDGEPIVNVHIAHICAHSEDGPRFRKMTLRERDSFSNLILLCKAHHTPVDRKSNEKKYPEELLRRWKRDREGDFTVQLSGLDGLDEEKLQDMMAAAVTETKREMMAAVDELANINTNTADKLRTLVAETFDRPYLDLDAVASLAESARSLRHLEDNATILFQSATMLNSLEGNVASLRAFADHMNMSGSWDVPDLQVVTQNISNLLPELRGLEQIVSRMEQATESLDDYNPIIEIDDPQRWRYFWWGVGVGVFVVVAIVVLIVAQVGP